MKTGPKAHGFRLRRFEAGLVACCLLVLLLLGPLRGLFDGAPLVPFAGAMLLLAAPGALLARTFARDFFPEPALVPAAIALGTGLYGLLAIPFLLLHLSLGAYLYACAAVLAVSLVAAAVLAFRPDAGHGESATRMPGERLLWAPFLVLGGMLVFLAGVEVPWVDGDTWNYLAWVREHLSGRPLATQDPYFGTPAPELSRVQINGWMLEQAALSRITGIDPVPLVIHYLSPALVAVSLLAFYALARLLFASEGAALLAGCLCALLFLANLDGAQPLFGREFLGRVVQDKGVARFVFFPVALGFAVAYLRWRRPWHLVLFGLLCWAVVGMHPAGLAITGVAVGGLGLLHVASSPRRIPAWTGAAALGAALLSILLVPLAYVLLTGRPLSSALYSADIGASDPLVLANQVFVRTEWQRIFVLGDGSYIMHPSLVLDPPILAAYLLGIPLLLWRILRGDRADSTAAQLVLGTLLAATVVCYVPPVATFLGDEVVAPGQLHRLSWPIPLAALLVLGWVAWTALRWASGRVGTWALPVLSLGLVVALSVAAAPQALDGAKIIYRYKDDPRSGAGARLDPAFGWMRANITERSVVFAPDGENVAIPAHSADTNVVSFRGAQVIEMEEELERLTGEEITVPRGALDVHRFFSGATPADRAEILRRNRADYAMAPAGGPVDAALRGMPGLVRLETPGVRYALYRVDRGRLGP